MHRLPSAIAVRIAVAICATSPVTTSLNNSSMFLESFKVIRHVRPKFTCTGCDRVVEAPAPSRPIEQRPVQDRSLHGPM